MGLRNIIKSLFARNDMKDEKETNSSQDLISVIPSDEPYLHFISENRRKEQSAETDKELRQILYNLTCPEYEKTFQDLGFDFDDGKRPFSPNECNEKLSFFIDRLYEKRGTQRHWIKASTSPNVFFKNLQDYEYTLKSLISLEPFYAFYSPTPSEDLEQYYCQKEQWQMDFVERWWQSKLKDVTKLKTVESKKKNLNKYFEDLEIYRELMAVETLAKVEYLKTIPLENIQAPEKDQVSFGAQEIETEKELIKEYNSSVGETSRHFVRIKLIDLYIKFRHIEEYKNKCIVMCKEDIEHLPQLDVEERSELLLRQKHLSELTGTPLNDNVYQERYERGFTGRISAFEKLIMIYQNSKNYKEALNYCDMASMHYKNHGIGNENIEKKKERILKLMEKSKK